MDEDDPGRDGPGDTFAEPGREGAWSAASLTASASNAASSSGDISSILQARLAQDRSVHRPDTTLDTHLSMRPTLYPSNDPFSNNLNRCVPTVSTILRPSGNICTLWISSIVPYSLIPPTPSAPREGKSIPKRGESDSIHRRIISLYRGSKTCRMVGIPGNASVQTKMGVSSRASRSSFSILS